MVVRTGCARTAHLIAQIKSVGMMGVEVVAGVVESMQPVLMVVVCAMLDMETVMDYGVMGVRRGWIA
jgi:hypothetical protein